MIRARDVRGRAVVDLDTAEKIGEVDDLSFDPVAARLVAILVDPGQSMLSSRDRITLPASAVRAFGVDAVTVSTRAAGAVSPTATSFGAEEPATPVHLSHLLGRQMVTTGGTVLGDVDDVLVDEQTGSVHGYVFTRSRDGSSFGSLFGGGRGAPESTLNYVRASADLRHGPDMIVVPDDAVVRDTGPRAAPGVEPSGLSGAAGTTDTVAVTPPVEVAGASTGGRAGYASQSYPDQTVVSPTAPTEVVPHPIDGRPGQVGDPTASSAPPDQPTPSRMPWGHNPPNR